MLRERGLLPPLLRSQLRYLFMFTSWNPGGNPGRLANKGEINCLVYLQNACAHHVGNQMVHWHLVSFPTVDIACLSYVCRRTRRPKPLRRLWMPPEGRRQQQPRRPSSSLQVVHFPLLLRWLRPAVWPWAWESRCVPSAARSPGPATRWHTTP